MNLILFFIYEFDTIVSKTKTNGRKFLAVCLIERLMLEKSIVIHYITLQLCLGFSSSLLYPSKNSS